MSSSDTTCYTIVFELAAEYPSVSDLRSALEKGSDDVKIDTLRKIIVSTINGNPQVSFISFYDLRAFVDARSSQH
jgi:coatomer subunit beta